MDEYYTATGTAVAVHVVVPTKELTRPILIEGRLYVNVDDSVSLCRYQDRMACPLYFAAN